MPYMDRLVSALEKIEKVAGRQVYIADIGHFDGCEGRTENTCHCVPRMIIHNDRVKFEVDEAGDITKLDLN